MKNGKKQPAEKLSKSIFMLLVCAMALLAICGVETGVFIFNFGKVGNIYLNQSVVKKPQQTAPARSSVSRNSVARIYDKVARLNQLQRELNGQPSVPMQALRPASMQLQTPPGVSESDALKNTEQDLDKQINRLQQLLADNG